MTEENSIQKLSFSDEGYVQRRIRDHLHGTISLSHFENRLISTRWFQRLRYIRQLGFFHLVFPGAVHSRFEHSLGVMHLAGQCFDGLRDNLVRAQREEQRLIHKLSSQGIDCVRRVPQVAYELSLDLLASPYSRAVLRAAALLHDLGHCPYSHCSERFLPSFGEIFQANPDLPEPLKQAMYKSDSTAIRSSSSDPSSHSCHEAFSLMMVWNILTTFESTAQLPVYKQDVLALLSPHLEPHEDSPFRTQKGRGYRILRDLLSGLWDADRMDYLKRDSRQSAVAYGDFDADRMIHSMYGVYDSNKQDYYLGFHVAAQGALEDFLRARQSMFLQIYFHKTSVASEAMMQHLSRLLGGWHFPGGLNEYAALRDQDLEGILRQQVADCALSDHHTQLAQSLMDGLFCHRVLWKMVYERQRSQQEDVQQAMIMRNLLEQHGIPAEVITSSSQIARMEDMSDQHGDFKYRWLCHDHLGFLQISAIHPLQSLLMDHNSRFWMVRIYVEPSLYLEAKALMNSQMGL